MLLGLQIILAETNEMKEFFSLKACQISLALNRSWHIVFFFSVIIYATVYTFLQFYEVIDHINLVVNNIIQALQQFVA